MTLRTPEQRIASRTKSLEATGMDTDTARVMATETDPAREALGQIASGFPRVRIDKRAAKSRDIARKALKSLEA